MKLNEEEMYNAYPWLLTVPRVGIVEFSSLLFPKEYRTPFSFYLPHPETFFNNSLHLSEEAILSNHGDMTFFRYSLTNP